MGRDHLSWHIKDEAVLTELVRLMDLSSAEAQLLGSLQEQARAAAPAMVEQFYARLFRHEQTAEYLEGASMERLHSMVSDWFIRLFGGVYDTSYAQHRIGIGQIHVRIGLPVRYPLAMMDLILPFGETVARGSGQPDVAVAAFRKVLALDIAIFNQAYEDNQLQHLADLVGGERLARLLLAPQPA